jgi:hypothetical protein
LSVKISNDLETETETENQSEITDKMFENDMITEKEELRKIQV